MKFNHVAQRCEYDGNCNGDGDGDEDVDEDEDGNDWDGDGDGDGDGDTCNCFRRGPDKSHVAVSGSRRAWRP